MQTKYGFTSYSIGEFESWLGGVSIARSISYIQEHHTWLPSYAQFNGSNHFELQRNMKHHHVANNGWSDIGQHFSIFPDGTILTGRNLNNTPACIYGNNARAVCFESVGDFDAGRDQMTQAQRASILRSCAAFLKKIPAIRRNDDGIVYHHWFDLNTGRRTNGGGSTKSCPGTAFFGGNTVSDFKAHFLPEVLAALGGGAVAEAPAREEQPDRLVAVTADFLNIRTGPAADRPRVAGANRAEMGSILRVWRETNGWFKISKSKDHWVFGQQTAPVRRGVVNTDDTNCRQGPGTEFDVVGAFQKGDVVYVEAERDGWRRIGVRRWVKGTLVTLG